MFFKKVDATKGSLIKLIFAYTVPLIISSILQNLFHIADKVVLGNMTEGTNALASIAATGTVSELIISGAVGLSAGTAIVLARLVGQKDCEKIRETVDTSLILSILCGLLVAVAGFFLAPLFLTMTKCPESCFDGALLYMRIVLGAAPATLLYNYGSAILRSLNDTRRPLIYVIIAGVINVVLNVVLCLVLPERYAVAAVAVATLTSNFVSASLVLWRLCHLDNDAKVSVAHLKFRFAALGRILRFGIPSTISCLVHPLGNLQVMTEVNTYGADVLAGFSASSSIDTIPRAFADGFGVAATTFIGQNIGARNPERVKKSFWTIITSNVLITGTIGLLLTLSGEFWLKLVLGTSASKDIAVSLQHGTIRMLHVTLFMFLYAMNTVLSHSLQAFGYPSLASITNISFNLIFRVLWMTFIYPLNPVFSTIPLCFTVSWILHFAFYGIFFSIVFYRYMKKGICKKI